MQSGSSLPGSPRPCFQNYQGHWSPFYCPHIWLATRHWENCSLHHTLHTSQRKLIHSLPIYKRCFERPTVLIYVKTFAIWNVNQMKHINIMTEDQAKVAIHTFWEESRRNKNVTLPLMYVNDVKELYWSEGTFESTECKNSDSDSKIYTQPYIPSLHPT